MKTSEPDYLAAAKAAAERFPHLYELAKSKFGFPHVVVKEYRKETCAQYRHNPLVEALPALPTDETLLKALTYVPKVDYALRRASAPYRLEQLQEAYKTVVAHPRNVRAFRSMLVMMRSSYGTRKPYSAEDNADRQARYDQTLAGDWISPPRGTEKLERSMGITAPGGSGKTFFMQRAAELLSPAIYHPEGGFWQIPMMSMDMLPDDSVMTASTSLFLAMDTKLPGRHHSDSYKRANGYVRLTHAFNICREHNLGILHIDEGQNDKTLQLIRGAARAAQNYEDRAAAYLIAASNTSRIPFVITGTFDMLHTLGSHFSSARRLSGEGCETWRFYDPPGSGTEEAEDFNELCDALLSYQLVRTPITGKAAAAFRQKLWDLTQGVPDLIVKLFVAAQADSIAEGLETLSAEHLQRVFNTRFTLVAGGTAALEAEDPDALSKMRGVWHPSVSRRRKPQDAETQVDPSPPPGGHTNARRNQARSKRSAPDHARLTAAARRAALGKGVAPVGGGA